LMFWVPCSTTDGSSETFQNAPSSVSGIAVRTTWPRSTIL